MVATMHHVKEKAKADKPPLLVDINLTVAKIHKLRLAKGCAPASDKRYIFRA